ncbi:hypothetical protein ACLOJK_032702 [Asimina triloba]
MELHEVKRTRRQPKKQVLEAGERPETGWRHGSARISLADVVVVVVVVLVLVLVLVTVTVSVSVSVHPTSLSPSVLLLYFHPSSVLYLRPRLHLRLHLSFFFIFVSVSICVHHRLHRVSPPSKAMLPPNPISSPSPPSLLSGRHLRIGTPTAIAPPRSALLRYFSLFSSSFSCKALLTSKTPNRSFFHGIKIQIPPSSSTLRIHRQNPAVVMMAKREEEMEEIRSKSMD